MEKIKLVAGTGDDNTGGMISLLSGVGTATTSGQIQIRSPDAGTKGVSGALVFALVLQHVVDLDQYQLVLVLHVLVMVVILQSKLVMVIH